MDRYKLKLLVIIIFTHLLAVPCYAGGIMMLGGESAAAGGPDVSFVTFWLTLEEGDVTGTYDITGTHDCSQGDTSGTYTNATLDSGTPINGTYSLDIPTTFDTLAFTISSGDIAPQAEGRIGFWLEKYGVTWGADGAAFVSLVADASNSLRIRWEADGTDEFKLLWTQTGSARAFPATTGNSWAAGGGAIWVEVGWDVTNDLLTMWVDNVQVAHSTSDLVGEIAWTSLVLGDDQASEDFKLDNVIIGNSYSTSLYGLRNYTASQCSGVGALCQ